MSLLKMSANLANNDTIEVATAGLSIEPRSGNALPASQHFPTGIPSHGNTHNSDFDEFITNKSVLCPIHIATSEGSLHHVP